MGKLITVNDLIHNIDQIQTRNKLWKTITKHEMEFVSTKDHPFLGFKGIFMNPSGNKEAPNVPKPTNGYFWDMAYRPNGQNPVHIFARDRLSGKYLFITQPRVPLKGKMVVSVPAGLMNPKIKTIDDVNAELNNQYQKKLKTWMEKGKIGTEPPKPEPVPRNFAVWNNNLGLITALMELKQETGYYPNSPKACKIVSPHLMPKSAGMTDESATVVECKLNKKMQGTQQNEKGEDIDFLWMKPKQFIQTMKKVDASKVVAEYDTWMYMWNKKS